jgi:peroxiredoxin Q/BCP
MLGEGDKAPQFTGIDQNGKSFSLSKLKGKAVALYFYSEDDSPTCTIEACNLRDNFKVLRKKGIEVVGVSPDGVKSHKKFETKYSLPFTLLADPERKIIDQYGVWEMKKLFGREYMGVHRTTFLIDENGQIRKIFPRPRTKAHAEEILQAWKELGY